MSLEPPTVSETQNAAPLPVLHTPSEWSALDGVTVMDPDGWRGTRTLPAKSFDEPISRAEWEQRLSVSSQISPVTRPEVGEALSVVDRVALRLFAIKSAVEDAKARKWWAHALDEENREAWRRHARALLADIALGDDDEMRAWPEYQVLHPEGAVQGGYDDVSDAVNFQERVWPEATIRRRTFVSVSSEWTEVTA